MDRFYFTFRRYWSVFPIQSARGGVKTSRSTVSSIASALCGIFDGNAQDLSRVHHDFLIIDPELECALDDVRQLLVVMRVLRDDTSFLEQHACQHDFLADHKLALQQRVQVFQRNRVPWNVLQTGRGRRVFADRALGASMRLSARACSRLRCGGFNFFFVAALVFVFDLDFGMGFVTLMCTDCESVLLLRTCLPLCPLWPLC